MRFLIAFIFLTLLGCSSGENKSTTQADATKTSKQIDSTKAAAKVDTTEEEDESQVDVRKELIASYEKPILIDTFFIDDSKKVEAVFRYLCTRDSAIKVPARYNFDTKKDFVTHDFISDLTLLSGKDTLFKKQITKSTFDNLIDSSLKKYATLLFPVFSIDNDSIKIEYSITIPVTDVGVGVYVKFGKNGNYVIGQ